MDDLIEKLRAVQWEEADDCGRMPDDPTHKCVFVDMRPADFRALLREAADALEAAREYVAEADRRVGELFNKAQRSEAYALKKAAETLALTNELEAAREDAERYRCLSAMATQQADYLGPIFRIDVRRSEPYLFNFDAAVDAAIDQARGKGVADA